MQAKLIKLKVPDHTVIKRIVQRNNTQNIDTSVKKKIVVLGGFVCGSLPNCLIWCLVSGLVVYLQIIKLEY